MKTNLCLRSLKNGQILKKVRGGFTNEQIQQNTHNDTTIISFTETILDTVYLIHVESYIDTFQVELDNPGRFCEKYSEKYTEYFNFYFSGETYTKYPAVRYYYDEEKGQVLSLNDYISEFLTGHFVTSILFLNEPKFEYYFATDFNFLTTLTVEGVEYTNVLRNNFKVGNPRPFETLNPSVWLTKEDWIIKIYYKKDNLHSTTYTLIDKNIIKN